MVFLINDKRRDILTCLSEDATFARQLRTDIFRQHIMELADSL